MPIRYYYDATPFRLPHPNRTKKWLKAAISGENRLLQSIDFIFCSDEKLLEINLKYLSHDTLTDIITFDYGDQNNLSGEIYISIERIKENAQTYKVSEDQELHRIMIHGILHLCGYTDKSPTQKKLMTERENFWLAQRN